jgi:uncharacterized protein (TIGR00661 family)
LINGKNFNSDLPKIRILVAPLDWGLGHATRCIPIINELISQNCEVMIAASGDSYFLLKKEFPFLAILPIGGYKISYSFNSQWLHFKLFLQFPKITFSILKEKLWLKRNIRKYKIDAIISDNRPGMFSSRVPTVYITHQLLIKTKNHFSEKVAQKIHYYFIKKFTYCWIPDWKENGLAGELSHPENLPSNVLYIGALSRFELLNDLPEKYEILISISGPEPQRTIFEKRMLFQLQSFQGNILFIRGLPNETESLSSDNKCIKIINHLPAAELNKAVQQSKIIICRSGYTTVMDLVKLGKNAVLVPTPGQTEQEYLAKYLMEKKFFYSVEQDKVSLKKAIENASIFQVSNATACMNNYKKVISEFVQSL